MLRHNYTFPLNCCQEKNKSCSARFFFNTLKLRSSYHHALARVFSTARMRTQLNEKRFIFRAANRLAGLFPSGDRSAANLQYWPGFYRSGKRGGAPSPFTAATPCFYTRYQSGNQEDIRRFGPLPHLAPAESQPGRRPRLSRSEIDRLYRPHLPQQGL